MPGIGISVFIAALGAVLRYAVTATTQGFNIHTGGMILMVAGAVGVLLSLLFWTSFSPLGRTQRTRREVVTSGDDAGTGRVVRETRTSEV